VRSASANIIASSPNASTRELAATSIADMARKISVRARLPDSAEVLVNQA
jgi:hypothetical protein